MNQLHNLVNYTQLFRNCRSFRNVSPEKAVASPHELATTCIMILTGLIFGKKCCKNNINVA